MSAAGLWEAFVADELRFEAPAWLRLIWALPLLVLLRLLRRRAVRIDVPFLPLWERVFRTKARTPSLWRAALATALAAAAVATALVLLAGPYVEVARAETGPLVVIADRSAAAGPAAEEVARLAAVALGGAGPGAPSTLAAFVDGGARVVARPGSPAEARSAALLLPPASGSRDEAALGRVVRAVAADARVVVVTPFVVADDVPCDVVAVPIGTDVGGGLRGVALESDRLRGDRLVVVAEKVAGRSIRLVGPDGVVAESPAADRVEFAPPTRSGDYAFALSPGDADAADDSLPFRFVRGRDARVLLVAAGEGRALDAALAASGIVDASRSARAEPGRWREAAPGFDVVVLVGTDEPTPLPAGRYLLMDAAAPGLPFVRGAGRVEARATEKDESVPWLASLDPEAWEVRRASPWSLADGSAALVGSNRGPLVARATRGDVRALHVGPPPTVAASTLPLLEAFPLMLRGMLAELVPDVGPSEIRIERSARPARGEVPAKAADRNASRPGTRGDRRLPPARKPLRAPALGALLMLLVLERLLSDFGATD